MNSVEVSNFIARAHHLPTFASALKNGALRQAIWQYDAAFRSLSEDREDYYFDIFGEDDGYGNVYIRKLRDAFNELINLDGDALVTIQLDARDGLCTSCNIGDHCKLTDVVAEWGWMNKFREECIALEQPFQDDKISIATSANVFRLVLLEKFIH